MDTSSSEWELSKENIQPIKQGRKVELLRTALAVHPDDKFLEKRRLFEQELRSYAGDDPLSVWCEYIVWVEQTYPKGGREGNIYKLVQQCLSVLKDEERYYNDERFVSIWLKFASMSAKPGEIFNNMYTRQIGCKTARFYITWAWEMEQLGDFKRADEILLEGIKRNAEPLDLLKSTHQQFEVRLCKSFSSEPEKRSALDTDPQHRSAFTLLKTQKKNKAPVSRVGDFTQQAGQDKMKVAQQLPQKQVGKGIPFKIYSSENSQVSSLPTQNNRMPTFTLNSEGSKENEKKPGKWTKAKVPQAINRVPKGPDFVFHQDRTPTPGSVKKPTEMSNALAVRKQATSPPIALFEPPDPKKRPMYNKIKVYGGAEEYSFEEMKAVAWFKQQKKREKEQQRLRENEVLKQEIKDLRDKVMLLEKMALFNKHQEAEQLSGNAGPKSVSTNHQFQTCPPGSNTSAMNHDFMSRPKHTLDTVLGVDRSNSTSAINSAKRFIQNVEPVCQKSFNEVSNSPTVSDTIANMVQELYNGTLTLKSNDSCNQPSPNLSTGRHNYFGGDDQNSTSSKSCPRLCLTSGNKKDMPTPSAFKYPDPLAISNPPMPVQITEIDENIPSTNPVSIPFPIYRDESHIDRENIGNANWRQMPLDWERHEVETENMSKKENIAPLDRQKEITSEKRKMSGILQPSTNVHYVPLEEQQKLMEKEEEEEDDECLAMALPDTDNFTIVPPLNAEMFAAAAQFASTPCVRGFEENKRDVDNSSKGNSMISSLMPPPRQVPESSTILDSLRDAVKMSDVQKVHVIVKRIMDDERGPENYVNFYDGLKACYASAECAEIRIMIGQITDAIEVSMGKMKDCSTGNAHFNTFRAAHLSTIFETSREGSTKSSSSSCSSLEANRSKHGTYFSQSHPWSVMKTSIADSTGNSTSKSLANAALSASCNNQSIRKHSVSSDFSHKVPAEKEYCPNIDPFDPKLTSSLLKSLQVPISQKENFHTNSGSLGNIKAGMELSVGSMLCVIENLHAEGAYAKVYSARPVRSHMFDANQSVLPYHRLAIKVCKQANEWEFYICSQVNERLEERKNNVDVTDSVIQIKEAVSYRNNLLLVSDMYELGTLLDIINAFKKNDMGKSTAIPEILAMYFTLEMLQIVSTIHECGIIHADIKPDNFILNEISVETITPETLLGKTRSLRLIDFGRAIDLHLFNPGITFNQIITTSGFQCPEMKESKPWVFQPDWYGVAACIHVMLFADYMSIQKNKDGKWEPKKQFKRYWQLDVWQPLFHSLLNIPSSYEVPDFKPTIKIILTRLQKSMRDLKKCLRQAQHYGQK